MGATNVCLLLVFGAALAHPYVKLTQCVEDENIFGRQKALDERFGFHLP